MSCAHLTAESVVSSLHYFYHEKRKFSGGRLQNLTLDLKTIESSIFLNFRHFGGGSPKNQRMHNFKANFSRNSTNRISWVSDDEERSDCGL